MKHIYLILVFAVLAGAVGAQGNLQFNQILRIGTTPQTVPTGKVWKVVSYWQTESRTSGSFNTTTCSSSLSHSPFLINSAPYYHVKSLAWGNTTLLAAVGNDFPLWLANGEAVSTICANDFLSVIEFNVVTP